MRKNATTWRFPEALTRWAGSGVFDRLTTARAQWGLLTYYQRFESAVALVLTLVIALIILVALYRLSVAVVSALVFGALDPLEHELAPRDRHAIDGLRNFTQFAVAFGQSMFEVFLQSCESALDIVDSSSQGHRHPERASNTDKCRDH